MTGELDWEKIQSMFTLGGYNVSVELSNSSALLALIGLTQMQGSWKWKDYTEDDDIESALALGIDEIMTGSPMGNVRLIGESVITSNAASISIDDWLPGEWKYVKLFASYLKSDHLGVPYDQVLIQFNNDDVATSYNTVFGGFWGGTLTNNERIGTVPGIRAVLCSASDASDEGCFGMLECTLYRPFEDDRKKHIQFNGGIAGETSGELKAIIGTGVWENTDAIEKITLLPEYGSIWRARPESESTPPEVRLSMYGYE